MNNDRRQTGHTLVALLIECNQTGLISDESHLVATTALKYLQQQEFFQLKSQTKYAGQNTTTDAQLAICSVALPALEAAVDAWNNDDFDTVIAQVALAVTTDGKPVREKRKRGLRKG